MQNKALFVRKDLAYRFGVCIATVSKVLEFFSSFLSKLLCQIPIWMNRERNNATMPESFKLLYPKVRVVLDCTEMYIETPSDLNVQSDTWSSYKSRNTAKGLVVVAPNGSIVYVCDLVPGRMSDREVTTQCGLLELLEPGDEVMADRGFLIENELRNIDVKLTIPPFMRGKSQLSPHEEEVTRNIANLRVHVERIIREVKEFKILSYVFPGSMHDKMNDYWKICNHMVNIVNEPLLERSTKHK